MIGVGGGVQDIKARIGLEGAPQFAGQAKAAADSLGQISTQLARVAASAEDIGRLGAGMADIQADARASALAMQQLVGRMNEVQAASDRASRASNFMDRFGPGAVGVGGLLALKAAITGVADEMLRVQVRAETLQSSLRFAIGADTAREMAYLRRVTNELGLEFTSSARAYAGFAAAAKETRLEGAGARQVFESVASAAAVMGLSADNAQGVLLALQQMMSKGTVQAEELRGQLGERLPGAFQIAARAMGVTTGELGKMLEQGKVLAEDFLPKFAEQLKSELGDGAASAANRTEASLNRLANAWERFKGFDGGATSGFIAGQLNIATDAMNDFSGSVESARARGDGFFGQFVSGLGAIARFANPFNAVAYSAQDFGAKLRAAEEDLAILERRLDTEPGNIFTRKLIRDTEQLIERLRQAKKEKDALADIGAGGGRGFVNPQTVGAQLAERADLEAKLVEIRSRGLGVNKQWLASLQELDAMVRTGIITDAERVKRAQELTASTYKASRATSDAYDNLARDITRTIALNDARAQNAGTLTKGQELELQLNNRLADSLGKLTKAQAESIRQLIARAKASADAVEASAAAAKATAQELRLAEQLARTRATARAAEDRAIEEHLAKVEQERRAVLKSVQDRVASLQDEAAAVALTAGTNLSLAEGIEQVALARAREKLERYHEGSAPWEDVQKEIEAREKLLGLMADKRVREAGIKAAEETSAYWQRVADDAGKALADAVFNGGKTAGELLEDYFRTLVLRPLVEFAGQQGMAALLGLLGANAGGAGGGGGGGTNWLQGASTAKNAYDLAAGGSLYAQAGNYAAVYSGQAYGTAFGSQQSAMLAAQEGGMVSQAGASTMSGWASTAGWVAAIAAGVWKANEDYKAGFGRDSAKDFANEIGGGGRYIIGSGGLESELANALSKIGFSDRVADALSGSLAVSALFGFSRAQIRDVGITGSITGGDFSGNATAQAVQQAGAVRKLFGGDDKVTQLTTALPEEIGRFLDAGAAGIFDKAKVYGAALGLPVDQLASVSASISVKANEEGQLTQDALVESLAGYGDALVAGWSDAIKPLATYGEATAETVQRVGAAIGDINQVLSTLGLTALQASIDGGRAAVDLQALFGDAATFRTAAGQYLQSFYTEGERSALQLQAVADVLGNFNLAVPATRDGFRSLVEAQDLTTASGRQAFAALMGVSEAFASVVPAARSAADILRERQGLELELLRLQGDTAAIRALERAELDASNVALYDRIRALEDEQAAAILAERAAADAATATQRMADAWAQISATAVQGVESAYKAVVQAVGAEQQQLKASAEQATRLAQSRADDGIRALEQQARTIETTFGGITRAMADQVQRLEGVLAGDGGRAAALQVLRGGAASIASGRAVDADALRQAAGTASQISTADYASALDYRRAVAETAALLRQVGGAASGRQTAELAAIAAQQVAIEAASEAEIAAIVQSTDAQLGLLDSQLAEARAQVSKLIDIDDGVTGVAAALDRLGVAVNALSLVRGDGGPTGRLLTSGGQQVYGSAGGAVASRAVGAGWDQTYIRGTSGATATADVLRRAINDLVAADDWSRIVAVARSEGIDSNMVDAIMDWRAGTSAAAARLRGLPAFALGSAYVPETGPALVHQGERILTAPDNAELMRIMRGDGGGMVAELRALREEVARLRAENAAPLATIARNTRRSADVHESWDANGLPPTEVGA